MHRARQTKGTNRYRWSEPCQAVVGKNATWITFSLSLFLYIHIYIYIYIYTYIYIYICTRNSLGILQGFYEFLGPRRSQEVLGGPRRSQEVLGSPILLVES